MAVDMSGENAPTFEGGGGIFEDLGLAAFYRKVKLRLWMLALIPVFCILIANFLFLVVPMNYRGVLEVTPATIGSGSDQNSGALGGILGSSLLGGALGDAPSMDPLFKLYVESWSSNWFAKQIASNPAMLHELFPHQWSNETHAWVAPSGPGRWMTVAIKGLLGMKTEWSPPGPDEVKRFLADHVSLETTRGNVITKIVVKDTDPKLTSDLLYFGHQTISGHMRAVFRAREEENVRYLVSRLASVEVADYREAIINQLQQEQKFLMLALSKSEFAAQPLGLHVSERPVAPLPIQILLVAFLLALVAYAGSVFAASRWDWPLTFREVWAGLAMLLPGQRAPRRYVRDQVEELQEYEEERGPG